MRILATLSIIAILTVAAPAVALAECPGNLLADPGFEGNAYKTESVGTSLSSNMVEGWLPWSILGDATINREVEYKVINAAASGDSYRVHGGNQSQKFFTTWGTHTAGMYQRVRVPAGSRVVFSIWAQIYTGERELRSGGQFISDLEWPKDSDDRRGPGLYRVTAGIDPLGGVPGAFGAPPPESTVWSEPVTDFETRRKTESGVEYDAWVQLEVSAVAQGEWVTVYTRGMPEFAVKHNDSFWDDACLVALTPPTATPPPTDTPSPTPQATDTPMPTDTLSPTDTPAATSTPQPSDTPAPSTTPESTATPLPPTATATSAATHTLQPSITSLPPSETPKPTVDSTLAPAATPQPPTTVSESRGALLLYAGGGILVVGALAWLIRRRA